MSKRIDNAARMRHLLTIHDKLTAQEIADLLGLKTIRPIYEYKKVLKSYGCEIETIAGNKGGYRLKNKGGENNDEN